MLNCLKCNENTKQKLLCHLVCILICYTPILNLINGIINTYVSSQFIWDSLFAYTFILLLMFACLIMTIEDFKLDILLLIAFFLLGTLLTWVIYPENIDIRHAKDGTTILIYFINNFVIYYFARHLNDYKKLYNLFVKYSYILVVCSIINYFVNDIQNQSGGYMVFSYNMLPGVLILLINLFERKNILSFIVSFLGAIFVVLSGARGPLLCIAVCLIGYLLLNNKKPLFKLSLIAVIGTFAILVMVFFGDILQWLINLAETLDIESRTLQLILDGKIAYYDDRGLRQIAIINNINVFGHGFWGEWILTTHYAHNLELEILYQYGVLGGSIILICLFAFICHGFATKNIEHRMLILVMFSCSFIRMQVSGSYLNSEPVFYLMLALCTNSLHVRIKDQEYKTVSQMQLGDTYVK